MRLSGQVCTGFTPPLFEEKGFEMLFVCIEKSVSSAHTHFFLSLFFERVYRPSGVAVISSRSRVKIETAMEVAGLFSKAKKNKNLSRSKIKKLEIIDRCASAIFLVE